MSAATPASSAPLSFAQHRLWFLEQLQPGNAAYNILRAYRFHGALNPAILADVLTEIVRRHAVLRARFDTVDGQPVQTIMPPAPVALPLSDLSPLPEPAREDKLKDHLTTARHTPVELRGPLCRCELIRMAADDHVLVLTLHHIAGDGWSLRVLSDELAALYTAFAAGHPSPLPELPLQYPDFAAAQRARLDAGLRTQQLAYWRKQLAGIPPILELPTDHPRPDIQTFRAESISSLLGPDTLAALTKLARENRVTLFMLLLAAFQVLMHRLSGQEDIVVGVPVAGRSRIETEKMIGLFVNTLVARGTLHGNLTFLELLSRVRNTTLDSYEHEDLPFEELVRELQPERSLSHTPLFQVMLNMFQMAEPTITLPGLQVDLVTSDSSEAKYDLTLYVATDTNGLHLNLVSNRDLFEPARMREWLAQFESLLRQVLADPRQPIGAYSLLTNRSRGLLPDPARPIEAPRLPPVTETFAGAAARMPEHPALVQAAACCSYARLSQSSEQIARALLHAGVQRGTVVAVRGPRSIGLVAAVLGVLRSGGVLLAIDSSLPPDRQRLMASGAAAAGAILVGEPPADDDPIRYRGDLFVIPLDRAGTLAQPPPDTGKTLPAIDGDDPAYIFFTSGSTGTPKGVLGCHKGLSHFLTWQRETFAVRPDDRCAQLTGFSFDVIMRDLLLPLTSGATLHLPDETADPASPATVRWMNEQGITLLHIVPSVMQMWLTETAAERTPLRQLRTIFLAGEPLTDTLVRRWRSAFPDASTLVNLYGPTETTLAKGFHVIPAEPAPGIQPLGKPLPQSQLLILNPAGGLCGIGEPGEIVIRTPFRTFGYINAPEEHRTRFAPNPFTNNPADILYRTGDRGRFDLDGSVRFLGRSDDQVKIRGVRVEPGEVAATLARNPRVSTCCVLPRKKPDGDTRLVAYVVARPGTTAQDLRTALSRQLPGAMIPEAFVFMDALPMLPNGKVDRQSLPDRIDAEPAPSPTAPSSPQEARLLDIWRDVLGTPQMGTNDNFFDVGGHSLLGVVLIARIRKALGMEISLRTLFEAPSVAEMAKRLSPADSEVSVIDGTESRILCLQPGQAGTPALFLLPGGKGSESEFTVYGRMLRELNPAIPVYGFCARGSDGVGAPHRDMKALVDDYIADIRQLQPTGPYHIAGECRGGMAAHAIACQLQRDRLTVASLVIMDTIAYKRWQGRRLWHWFGRGIRKSRDRVMEAPPRARLAWTRVEAMSLLKLAQSLWGTCPANANPGDPAARKAHTRRSAHAYAAALTRHSPTPFEGSFDLVVSTDPIRPKCVEAWQCFATEKVRVHVVPGTHDTYVRDEAKAAGQILARCISQPR